MSDFILSKEHVGQIIILIGRDHRNKPEKHKAEVVKVNPKTVVLNVHYSETWIREEKLYKNDSVNNLLVFNKDYSSGYRVYLSESHYENYQRALDLTAKIRDKFSVYSSPDCTLEQLEKVAEILGLERNQ